MVEIRFEQPKDIDEIRLLNDKAFGQPDEGRIVDKLRKSCNGILSLVAISNNKIVGHIMFSPVTIETQEGVIEGMGLAPMAVLPEFQNQRIGSKLVKEGLRIIRKTSCPFVIVLGHEKYYPRFGFQRASKYGLESQWENIPDEAFMAMILDDSVMKGVSGIVRYRMSLMTTKDLDDKLLNVFKDCPYKGKREDCTFPEMRDMEVDKRLDFLDKIDENEKVTRWKKHLKCLMNALAK